MTFRDATAKAIAPILAITGFRFSKQWRWNNGFIYRNLLNTTYANVQANRLM